MRPLLPLTQTVAIPLTNWPFHPVSPGLGYTVQAQPQRSTESSRLTSQHSSTCGKHLPTVSISTFT